MGFLNHQQYEKSDFYPVVLCSCKLWRKMGAVRIGLWDPFLTCPKLMAYKGGLLTTYKSWDDPPSISIILYLKQAYVRWSMWRQLLKMWKPNCSACCRPATISRIIIGSNICCHDCHALWTSDKWSKDCGVCAAAALHGKVHRIWRLHPKGRFGCNVWISRRTWSQSYADLDNVYVKEQHVWSSLRNR